MTWSMASPSVSSALLIVVFPVVVIYHRLRVTLAVHMRNLRIISAWELILNFDRTGVLVLLADRARVRITDPNLLEPHAGGFCFLVPTQPSLPVRHCAFRTGDPPRP